MKSNLTFRLTALLMLLAVSSASHALLIMTAGGDTYHITTDDGTRLATLDDQPWWNNQSLAEELRDLVGMQLGAFGHFSGVFDGGPIFAFTDSLGAYCQSGTPCDSKREVFVDENFDNTQDQSGVARFAIGRLADGTIPEPATLALMGLGLAGIGYSRKRKAA